MVSFGFLIHKYWRYEKFEKWFCRLWILTIHFIQLTIQLYFCLKQTTVVVLSFLLSFFFFQIIHTLFWSMISTIAANLFWTKTTLPTWTNLQLVETTLDSADIFICCRMLKFKRSKSEIQIQQYIQYDIFQWTLHHTVWKRCIQLVQAPHPTTLTQLVSLRPLEGTLPIRGAIEKCEGKISIKIPCAVRRGKNVQKFSPHKKHVIL